MLSRDTRRTQVLGYIATDLQLNENEAASITLETNLDGSGVDSLDIIEAVMALEDKYDIEISEDAMDQMVTFGDLVEFVLDAVDEQEREE